MVVNLTYEIDSDFKINEIDSDFKINEIDSDFKINVKLFIWKKLSK